MKYAGMIVVAACGGAPVAPVVEPAPVKPAPVKPAAAQPVPAQAYAAPSMPAGSVHGRVVLDGKPVPYFGLTYTRDFSFSGVYYAPIAIHTTDGEFTANVPEGHWDLIVAAPGAARQLIAGVDVGTSLDLGTLSLRHGHTISGVVRDANGAPVAGARVDYRAQHHVGSCDELCGLAMGNVSTHTDDHGHYELRGVARAALATGRPELVASTDDGLASIAIEPPDADAQRDLQLSPTGTIRVTLTGGRPMGVVASAQHARILGHLKDGVAEIEHVPVGSYEITAMGTDRRSRVSQTVAVRANQVESLTLALPIPALIAVEVTASKRECTEIQLRDAQQDEVALAPCTGHVATFPALEPDVYLACIDKKLCRPIIVEPTPAQQKFDVPR